MEIIPAVDLKEGQIVRLRQGDFAQKTVYAGDPLEAARHFQEKGAPRLHIVDLDGTQSGRPSNQATVESLVDRLTIPLQLGGGIRSVEAIDFWLSRGVDRVVVGTLALEAPGLFDQALDMFGGKRLILAVDVRDGSVMTHGWQTQTSFTAAEIALRFKPRGLKRVLFTDISRDGMFSGPNLETTRQLAQETGLRVIASGGISTKKDLANLAALKAVGVEAAVVGKAIYENRLTLEELFSC